MLWKSARNCITECDLVRVLPLCTVLGRYGAAHVLGELTALSNTEGSSRIGFPEAPCGSVLRARVNGSLQSRPELPRWPIQLRRSSQTARQQPSAYVCLVFP